MQRVFPRVRSGKPDSPGSPRDSSTPWAPTTANGNDVKLSLGPVLYYWTREPLLGFYANLPHARLSTIYLGEVVCGRRHEMRPADWLGLARDLARTGVEVVLSTQALIESELDLRAMRHIAENGEFLVEANDMGAVRLLANRVRFVAGPHLNVYNPQTLAWLAGLGACRWVMPVELGRDALALLPRGAAAAGGGPEG